MRAQAAVFLTQNQILMIMEMCSRELRETDEKRSKYEALGKVGDTLCCERYLSNAHIIRCKMGEALEQF